MERDRALKDLLYEQVARLARAVASPKRLELIELLCQAEKGVDTLAQQAHISVKLASAHLKQLKAARLVDTRRDGKRVLFHDTLNFCLWIVDLDVSRRLVGYELFKGQACVVMKEKGVLIAAL